jgi:hypothetical protein
MRAESPYNSSFETVSSTAMHLNFVFRRFFLRFAESQ